MTVDLRAILPSQGELDDMGRRRAQHPSIFKTQSRRPEWYFRARVDVLKAPGEKGRVERTYYLGYCDEMGKKGAEKARDAILTEAINQPALVLQSQMKFQAVVDAYKREYLPTLRPVTALVYESVLRRVEQHFGERRLCDITPQAVQSWANGLPAGQRKRIVRQLGMVWKVARAWGYTQFSSPTEFVRFGQSPLSRASSIPTQAQYIALRGLLDGAIADMADVAIGTGLRISEIRGLPVRCVDLAAGVIRIEQRLDEIDDLNTPKSHCGHRVLPIGALKPLFQRVIADKNPNDLVFDAGCYRNIQEVLKTAAAAVKCDFRGFGWHTLRRYHNTWLRKSGASVEDRMDQMGHASVAMNDVYNIRDEEDFRRREKLVLKLQADLMGQAAGPKQ